MVHASEVRRCKTEATKILAKVAPLQVEFSNLLADRDMAHVPRFATQKAKAAAKQLGKLEGANDKLHLEGPAPFSVTIKGVADIVQEARSSLLLLKDLLQTARKHMG